MIRLILLILSITIAFGSYAGQSVNSNDSLLKNSEVLWLKADNYFSHDEFDSSIPLLMELYENSDNLSKERRFSVLHRLSTSYLLSGDYRQALKYGLELYGSPKPKDLKYYDIPAFLNLISVYNWENQLSRSNSLCEEMLGRIKSIDIPKERQNDYMCKVYVQASITYNRLKNPEKALKLIDEAKRYADTQELRTLCDFNAALIHKELDDDDSAMSLYARIIDSPADDVNTAIALGNYLELLVKHNQYETAISIFNKRKSLLSLPLDSRFVVGCYSNVAKAYASVDDYESAYSYMAKAKEQTDTVVAKLKNDFMILSGDDKQASDEDGRKGFGLPLVIIVVFVLVIIACTLYYFLLKNKSRLRKVVDENKAAQEDIARQSYSEREMISAVMQLSEVSEAMTKIHETTLNDKMPADKKLLAITSIVKQYDTLKGRNEIFNHLFSKLNGPFLHRLKETHPNLSANEERLCSLIVVGFSTKEIAEKIGSAPRAVETAKYRLKKKFQLSSDQSTTDYLKNIMSKSEA